MKEGSIASKLVRDVRFYLLFPERSAFEGRVLCNQKSREESEEVSVCTQYFVLHWCYEAPASVSIVATTPSIPTELLIPAQI